MRRAPGVAAVTAIIAGVVAGTLGLGGCEGCSGFSNDFVNDATGEATPGAAIALWLESAEHGYDTNPEHWHASTAEPLVFHAGSSMLTVVHFEPPGSGYLVGEGNSC